MKTNILRRICPLALAAAVATASAYKLPDMQASAAEQIVDLQVFDTENAADWSVQSNLQEGDLVFGDRDVTYEMIPGFLVGAEYIRTACDSKSFAGDLAAFTAGTDMNAYVCMDDRVNPTPDWLSGWTDTGEDLFNSSDVSFSIYQAAFDQGETVTLGSNGQSGGCVNYTVMVTEKGSWSLRGDVNADGQFSVADVVMLQKWLICSPGISLSDWNAGDLCEDQRIDVFDLCIMKRELLAKNTEPDAPDTPDTPVVPPEDREFSFDVKNDLFNQNNTDTLGLSYPEGLETVTVWKADDDSDHYCNGVALTGWNGKLYCQWQSSATDEDAPETRVMYAVSEDGGRTWSEPIELVQDIAVDGVTSDDTAYCSSGGWFAAEDQLIAYINVWPGIDPRGGFTYYMASQDGVNWSDPQPVTMADGSPMKAIFEQDPHVLASGRIVNSAHFQDGLIICPIYTDDPNGISGWKKGDFTASGSGTTSTEMEPSLFVQDDGTIVMIFRDQSSSYRKILSYSLDDGVTWSKPQQSEMPDARTKQSAGNLSDGTAFMAGSPVTNSLRSPLAVVLSADGKTFDTAFLLRSNESDPELVYEGKAKRKGFHYCKSAVYNGYLYVGYATNKEAVEISIVPEESIMLN